VIALELGIAFVTGGLVGAIAMAIAAARGNDGLVVENARLQRANEELRRVVTKISDRHKERIRA